MNRCDEIERSLTIHEKGLNIKIGACSNVKNNCSTESGYKVKDKIIPDNELPMHYVRAKRK